MSLALEVYTSAVTNTSGSTLYCPYLPVHGRKLSAGEQVTYVGDIWQRITEGDRDPKRARTGLLNAVNDENLSLDWTPTAVLQDASTGDSYFLYVSGGSTSLADVMGSDSESA